jgi:hypothetical protein
MSGTVERNFSVDDLVGGIFRLQAAQGGGSMRKSDSEAAFQEFLKRIPSSSNLGGGGLSSQLHLDQLGSTNSLEAVANAGVLGLPRVPSVDFLRQLASVQHQMNSGVSSPGFRVEDAGGAAMHPGEFVMDQKGSSWEGQRGPWVPRRGHRGSAFGMSTP